MSGPRAAYIGRFAPSPTGPLHLGSLIAAVASFVDARHHNGRWLIRIDDLDPPREVAGADVDILRTLYAHGLHWDGEPRWQSEQSQAYAAALEQLQGSGNCFRCDCSRARQQHNRGIYDGHCRTRPPTASASCAIRVKVDDRPIFFVDLLQGPRKQNLASAVGDFVIRRKDALFAYQLAVVVDDAAAKISHVVRGSDLLSSTPRQIYLQRLLGLSTPAYLHFPVAIDPDGRKLSKQNRARSVSDDTPGDNLRAALRFLGQRGAPRHLQRPTDILHWATRHWQRDNITRSLQLLP